MGNNVQVKFEKNVLKGAFENSQVCLCPSA